MKEDMAAAAVENVKEDVYHLRGAKGLQHEDGRDTRDAERLQSFAAAPSASVPLPWWIPPARSVPRRTFLPASAPPNAGGDSSTPYNAGGYHHP